MVVGGLLIDRDALSRLADADRALADVERRSMDGTRGRARSLVELADALAPRLLGWSAHDAQAWADGLARVAFAIRAHFPENLFWDLDHLAASAVAIGPADMREQLARVEQLNAQFGVHTAIRFRYVHDFLYGFDWAKWVRRAPQQRASIGPLDLEFLRCLEVRGAELEQLIARDDAMYPRLRGAEPRNPFPFSREPEDELRLHRDLASLGAVPVPAWKLDAEAIWNRAFADERVTRARALGLATLT